MASGNPTDSTKCPTTRREVAGSGQGLEAAGARRPDARVEEDQVRHRRSGGTAPVDELVARNAGWLRGWLGARLHGRERQEIDDLAQEILLRALKGRRSLRRVDRFPGWLYRIAVNVLRDHLRRAARTPPERIVREDDAEAGDRADLLIERQEEFEFVLSRLLELPRRYREPMVLRHVDDLSYADIARILGIRENAVQVRLFRARQMLRSRCGSQRVTPRKRVSPEKP